MLQFIRNLLNRDRSADETGASAVEYGLLVAGIAAVIVATVFAFSGTISGLFTDTENCIAQGAASTC
ncbi:MAG TPA: Flp family type IVb pilin [Nocardioides sp.]|nr:Flp family type IVb pilin [Nocardioides sp.]